MRDNSMWQKEEDTKAAVSKAIGSLTKTLDKLKWLRCRGCREEYRSLQESGLCIFCQPRPGTVHKRPESKVETVFSAVGIDSKSAAFGDDAD